MKRTTAIFFGLIFLACTPIFLGIFHPGFFLTDDGNWMVIRLSAFYETLRIGQFPVRFLPRLNNGYGYPVTDFLYPLFLYIGSYIHAFNIPYVQTVKIEFALGSFFSGIGTYIWLRKRFNDIAGFVGALVYMLFPYHIWDITKRGSLGEVLALGIIPYILFWIDTGNVFLSGIGIALLITAHNTLALLFLPIIIVYFLLERKYHQMLLSIVLGIGLSTFFWFPALFDLQFTVFHYTPVSQFTQYFLSENLYPLIGISSFFVILFSLVRVIRLQEKIFIFFLCVVLLSISLTNKLSIQIWQIFHLGSFVQFPFRFLSITTLGVTYLSSYIVYTAKKYRYIFSVIILALLYMSSWQFFFAKSYQTLPDTYYSTNESTSTIHDEYMPIWVNTPLISSGKTIIDSHATITNVIDKGTHISFSSSSQIDSFITLERVYFPGWTGQIDKKPIILSHSPTGLVYFPLPKGEHNIRVWFGETPFRFFADGVSIIAILVAATLWILQRKGVIHV